MNCSRFLPDTFLADIDSSCIKLVYQMGGVVFFDHLDAGATVFCDLIYVSPFQQPEGNVAMSQAVKRSSISFTIEF